MYTSFVKRIPEKLEIWLQKALKSPLTCYLKNDSNEADEIRNTIIKKKHTFPFTVGDRKNDCICHGLRKQEQRIAQGKKPAQIEPFIWQKQEAVITSFTLRKLW